jgi:hypothetical protein
VVHHVVPVLHLPGDDLTILMPPQNVVDRRRLSSFNIPRGWPIGLSCG